MDLTIQLYFDAEWQNVAVLSVRAPDAGFNGATTVSYEMQYFAEVGAIPFSEDKPLRDARAISVDMPVDLEDRILPGWPPFLLDLLPQGLQRDRIAANLGVDPELRSSDIRLLMHGAGSPVGNIRIKEARVEEVMRIEGRPKNGVRMDDMLNRTDRFLEVADNFALLASGSSGLQGNWPKIAMTKAADGMWYPDSTVNDDDAREHVIVKFSRSNEAVDEVILRSEAAYSAIAAETGLNVQGKSLYGSGVLVVPRFDRAVGNGGLTRFGQESFVSAIGVSAFNHQDSHENYLRMLRAVSCDPLADVTEYVLRDVLNLAMGNPDNHGRNSALRKDAECGIRLSPLFDFAPMKLSPAVIVRSTKWECMRASGRDYNPDWKVVCEAAAGGILPVDALIAAVAEIEDAVRALPDTGRRHGLSDDVITRAFASSKQIADGITAMKRAI